MLFQSKHSSMHSEALESPVAEKGFDPNTLSPKIKVKYDQAIQRIVELWDEYLKDSSDPKHTVYGKSFYTYLTKIHPDGKSIYYSCRSTYMLGKAGVSFDELLLEAQKINSSIGIKKYTRVDSWTKEQAVQRLVVLWDEYLKDSQNPEHEAYQKTFYRYARQVHSDGKSIYESCKSNGKLGRAGVSFDELLLEAQKINSSIGIKKYTRVDSWTKEQAVQRLVVLWDEYLKDSQNPEHEAYQKTFYTYVSAIHSDGKSIYGLCLRTLGKAGVSFDELLLEAQKINLNIKIEKQIDLDSLTKEQAVQRLVELWGEYLKDSQNPEHEAYQKTFYTYVSAIHSDGIRIYRSCKPKKIFGRAGVSFDELLIEAHKLNPKIIIYKRAWSKGEALKRIVELWDEYLKDSQNPEHKAYQKTFYTYVSAIHSDGKSIYGSCLRTLGMAGVKFYLLLIEVFLTQSNIDLRKHLFDDLSRILTLGKLNEIDQINHFLSFDLLHKLNSKNKNLADYQIESEAIATHSKNPTYALKIDNTLTLMKQILEGEISEVQFQNSIDRQQWFIKAYKENEEYRAHREASVSKQISEQSPKILLAPYTYLGTIYDDKNHPMAIPYRDGVHTHFIAAPLEQGVTLNQFLAEPDEEQRAKNIETFQKAITALAKFHQTKVVDLEIAKPFNEIILSTKAMGGGLIDFINKNVVANLNGWQTAQKDFVTAHYDAHLENFYVTTNGEVKLLDFESVKKGHPYHDLMFILNHESLSHDNQKDLLIKYWNERGKKTTETEAEVQLKQIRKLYAAELGKRFAYHATQYAISIQKAKKCRKDNLSVLFERHIKDARIALGEQIKFLNKLKDLSQKYADEFTGLENELIAIEPALQTQWNETQKLFDLHCRVSFEDVKGNLIQFRSGPERQLAVFLKNFIKGFKLEKGKSFEPKINGKLPDFYIEVGNRKIIIEYHPAAIERYDEKNKELSDEALNANYLARRKLAFPGYEVIVIADYPLTAQSIYEKLKLLLKGTETISDYEKTFEEAMGQIHDFETEYNPNYGTMATQMTLGTIN